MPREIGIKYVMGKRFPIILTAAGMVYRGNMNPPSNKLTIINSIINCCAWRWFCEIDEMSKPSPNPLRTYKEDRPINNQKLPWNGTPNQKTPMAITVSILSMAMITYGIILPIISSNGRIGVTRICSIVPISRSRTTAAAVSARDWVCNNMAAIPGIMNHSVLISGL